MFGDTSTGAESGTQQLTDRPGSRRATQQLIDEQVRRIADDAHQEVVALLEEHRSNLDSLADALLEHEALDEEDAYAAASAEPRTAAARSRLDE